MKLIHGSFTGGRARMGAALLAVAVGACDFIESSPVDPNAVPNAELDQLLTAAQVNSYFVNETEISRLSSMWIQQMQGTDRQFVTQYNYIITEEDGEDVWNSIYRAGGLNEIRRGIALADSAQRSVYSGIFKIHEAFLVGLAAAAWGDIPFSEAVNPEIQAPALDPQLDVYASLQTLLDEAIANLEANTGVNPAAVDLNFGGDPAAWIAVAHSLKARFYMHVAEADASAYQNALTHAQQGISSVEGNWHAVHSTATTENNLWYVFNFQRSGYISPNPVFVGTLSELGDPRRDLYFSGVSSDGSSAAGLNIPGSQDFNQPILTCAETQFIEAEAALALGDPATARQALADGIACEEAFWGVSIDYLDPAIVPEGDLLETIMRQKWIALFLNPEAWNDYKRTCLPSEIVPVSTIAGARQVPPGLYYPQSERIANPNVPPADDGTLRNPNDPNPCP